MGSQCLMIKPSGDQSKTDLRKSKNGTDRALTSSHSAPKNAVSGSQLATIWPSGDQAKAVFIHSHTAIAGALILSHTAWKYGATVDQLAIRTPAAMAIPRTIMPTGLMLATPFIRASAAEAPAVAKRSTVKPTAAPSSPLISQGCAPAKLVTPLMIGPTVAMKSLSGGSNMLPTVIPRRVTRFCSSCMALAVVSDRDLYSASIEPA